MLSHITRRYVLLVCLSLLNIYNVNAENINIQGRVVPGACNVSPTDQVFTFEDLYTGNIDEAGSSSQWIDFNVSLTGCPVSTQKVLMKISGTPATDATYFANNQDALNVVLQLTDPPHLINYSNGSVMQTKVDDRHSAIFPLSARIYTPQGEGGAGDFESVIMFDFTYQ